MDVITCPPFENLLNLRDVGLTINKFTGKKFLREGVLFRSARPDDATLADRKRLRDDYAIKTVMDLRTKTEHLKQAHKREADLKGPAQLYSNDALAEPVKIPGLQYLEININGKGFERALLWKLRIWSLIKLIFLMALGYRIQAISILGREVMLPRGLLGLGFDSIDYCGHEIGEAMREFADQSRYPILVHCTQGKDRTGLLVALLLFLMEVRIEAITYDYTMSEGELLPERESRMKEIREIGLSEEFAGTPKDWIIKMKEHLDEKFGGVKRYLDSIGVNEEMQGRLVKILSA